MNRKIYKQIAKKYGVTWQSVRDDIQSALNHAYQDQSRNTLNLNRQQAVPKKGDIPTPEEFIHYASSLVKNGTDTNHV